MKEQDKIENLPTHSRIRKQIEGVDLLRKIVKLISVFGFDDKGLNKILDKVPDFKRQIIHLAKLPDIFNNYFSKGGWIAHESMNYDLMEKSVNLAVSGNITEANQQLVNYYCSSEIEWLLMHFKSIPEFAIRYDLIELAYQDTIDEKYYSCIPILLMVIDGSVNDIDKNKGFFTGSTDLTAWDSIAAHSSGLSVIRDVFNSSRNKTTTEPIDMPYRNGILHGRDIGYANKIVTAKCWAALFAIKDWAVAIKEGKKKNSKAEKELSFTENLSEIRTAIEQYTETKRKSAEVSRKVEQWKPRLISIGENIPKSGKVSDYADFYPEKEAILFAIYWQKKNYGKIAEQIKQFSLSEINIGKEAKRIRELLDNKKLIKYEIISIVDISPAISETTLQVIYEYNNMRVEKIITLRFICEGNGGEVAMIGDKNCKWKFIDNFFYELDFVN